MGGAQKYYGVVPDLCMFGKGMANGFSVAAPLGKRDVIKLGGIDHGGERVSVYRDALNGNVRNFLVGRAIKPVFRKYN